MTPHVEGFKVAAYSFGAAYPRSAAPLNSKAPVVPSSFPLDYPVDHDIFNIGDVAAAKLCVTTGTSAHYPYAGSAFVEGLASFTPEDFSTLQVRKMLPVLYERSEIGVKRPFTLCGYSLDIAPRSIRVCSAASKKSALRHPYGMC